MIIVILVVAIALLVGGVSIYDNTTAENTGTTMGVVGGLATVIAGVALIVMLCGIIKIVGIDERIAMYEEENVKIEQQIAEVVTQYQQYEKEIFTEVKPESSMTLVSLYPELKSDTLVQKQIEVYTANNEKIKALKEREITAGYLKWWLYFGK